MYKKGIVVTKLACSCVRHTIKGEFDTKFLTGFSCTKLPTGVKLMKAYNRRDTISMNDVIQVIGVDCATEPQNVGISIGCYEYGWIELHKSMLGDKSKAVADTIHSNRGSFSKVLYCY
jgi:hypothetical protein